MKKKLACLLCAVMMIGIITGCGEQKEQNEQTSQVEEGGGQEVETAEASGEEPYEVGMRIALPAAVPSEEEMNRVVEHINELTMKELNMTLKLEIIPFSSYIEQIQLDLSAGSDIDLFVMLSAYGPSWVNAGYLVDMKDLLEEYGKDILSSYSSPELASVCDVNGTIYAVPVHKEISQQPTIFFRTDILEKHNIDVSNIKSIADVDALFEQVSELEPDMWMLAADNLGLAELYPVDYIGGLETYAIVDPANNSKVVNYFETDDFREWCDYNHKWFTNGWVNSGAASDTESYYTYITSGQAFAFFSDSGHPLSEADQENNCGGVDLTMVNLGESWATTSTSCSFCYAISSGSKDPVKAMKMLNFMTTNTEIMNLLNWGVEGEDYVVNADGLLDYPEGKDASSVGYHLGAGWVLPNQFVCTPWSSDGSDIYEKLIDYNNEAIISRALGFTFDSTPVADEISAVSNVKAKYYKALITGAVDPEEYIEILVQEMEDAGSDKVIAEMQKQLDEYLASK